MFYFQGCSTSRHRHSDYPRPIPFDQKAHSRLHFRFRSLGASGDRRRSDLSKTTGFLQKKRFTERETTARVLQAKTLVAGSRHPSHVRVSTKALNSLAFHLGTPFRKFNPLPMNFSSTTGTLNKFAHRSAFLPSCQIERETFNAKNHGRLMIFTVCSPVPGSGIKGPRGTPTGAPFATLLLPAAVSGECLSNITNNLAGSSRKLAS